MKPLEVSLPNETTVRVERTFDAPAALVWRAYTEPALIQRWMLGHPGWTMPVCEMDLRVGGTYRWRWRNDADGKEFGFHGEFQELVQHKKIVNTEFFDPGNLGMDMGQGALNSTSFSEVRGKTTLVQLIQYKSQQDRDAALATGMTDGMEVSYKILDALLLNLAA